MATDEPDISKEVEKEKGILSRIAATTTRHPVVSLLGMLVVAFSAGFGAYRAMLEATNQQTVVKGTWVAKEDHDRILSENRRSRDPRDEKAYAIERFYNLIEARRFEEAWTLIHRARKAEVPLIRNWEDFAKTYSTTMSHQNVEVRSDQNGETEATYLVRFDVEDRFLTNMFYQYRERSVREIFDNGVMNKDQTLRIIFDNLRTYFFLPEEEQPGVEEFLLQQRLDFLYSPLFISEVGRLLNLEPRETFENAPRVVAWRHFILRIKVAREDSDWKIRSGLYPPVAAIAYGPGDMPAR
jgi:hypothetical protein